MQRSLYWPSLALFSLFVYLASRALVHGALFEAVVYMISTFFATLLLASQSE